MSRILIVEDEQILREVVKDYLLHDGHEVLEAADGERALELFEEHTADLVILDIMLPRIDGWTVCRRIRKTSNVPVIMLTARADEDDYLLGYELGADDYLIKPYNPRILMAKVNRFLERLSPTGADKLDAGGIELFPASRSVQVDGQPAELTHTEFEILFYLMQNQNQVISREQLISKVWGYDFIGDEKTVNSHIRNLRAKLGSRASCIVTMIRSGYKFEV